jgi:hypothetical protein
LTIVISQRWRHSLCGRITHLWLVLQKKKKKFFLRRVF